MAVFAAVVIAALFLEHNHLVAFYEAFGYFAYNFGSVYNGCAYLYFAVIVGKKNAVELDCVTFFYIVALSSSGLLRKFSPQRYKFFSILQNIFEAGLREICD